MSSLKLIDIVLFLGAAHGLLLAVIFYRIENKNSSANKILSITLVMAAMMLVGRVIYLRYSAGWIPQWSLLPDVFIFIFGPLCFTYVRKLILNEHNPKDLSLIHYLPMAIHLTIFIYFLTYSQVEYLALIRSGKLRLTFFLIESSAIFLNFFYWFKSFRLIKSYRKEEKNRLSYRQNQISYLLAFQISIFICLTLWLTSFTYSNFESKSIMYVSYDTVWIAIPIFIYLIGYYSIKQPDIFRFQTCTEPVNPRKRLDEDSTKKIIEKLEYHIDEEKVFLKADLALQDLANTLGVSTHDLSWLLNNVYQTNFYDFVNKYRIEEFIYKLKNQEHRKYTILALSHLSGFNSKSTFNKAFKMFTNETPSNYIKKLELGY